MDEVGATLSVFTDDKEVLAKILESFKNVAFGLALEGVTVSVSIHQAQEDEDD